MGSIMNICFVYHAGTIEQAVPKQDSVSTQYCYSCTCCTHAPLQPRFCRKQIETKSLSLIPSLAFKKACPREYHHQEMWCQGNLLKTLRHSIHLFSSRKTTCVKPKLVFGGTYPIDVPISYRSRAVPTFNIDLPVSVGQSESSTVSKM